MAKFNWGQITKQATAAAKEHIKSGKAQKEIDAAMMRPNAAPEMAANVFVDMLIKNILSSGLSPHAIASIANVDHGPVQSNGDGTYSIDINFVANLQRESLQPGLYPDGINNLAALFNNGVDHEMKPVHGIWHGQDTWSRTVIPGSHFVEKTIREFMSGADKRYGVIEIQKNDIYE